MGPDVPLILGLARGAGSVEYRPLPPLVLLDADVTPVAVWVAGRREDLVDADGVGNDLDDRLAMVREQAVPLAMRSESMHRRVWLVVRHSVRSAALNAMKSPACCPSVWAMVACSPLRMRHRPWPGARCSHAPGPPRPVTAGHSEAIALIQRNH